MTRMSVRLVTALLAGLLWAAALGAVAGDDTCAKRDEQCEVEGPKNCCDQLQCLKGGGDNETAKCRKPDPSSTAQPEPVGTEDAPTAEAEQNDPWISVIIGLGVVMVILLAANIYLLIRRRRRDRSLKGFNNGFVANLYTPSFDANGKGPRPLSAPPAASG